MPAYSRQDQMYLDRLFRTSKLFPAVKDVKVRHILRRRVQTLPKILTFKSFHADMVLLEICYKPLRDLWPLGACSLRQICQESFQGCRETFDARYADMWLYCVRNFTSLSETKSQARRSRRKNNLASPRSKNPEIAKLAAFALSCNLSPQVTFLPNQDESQAGTQDDQPTPPLSDKVLKLNLRERCGRPTSTAYHEAWRQLSLRTVFGPQQKHVDEYATDFAVARLFVLSLLPSANISPGLVV